jgi:hypothetical protein
MEEIVTMFVFHLSLGNVQKVIAQFSGPPAEIYILPNI